MKNCNYTILVLRHWNCQFHFMPQKSLHQSDARPHTTRVYGYSSAAENGCHALVVKINGFESHRARLQRTERRPKTTNSSGRSSTSLTVWEERHSTGHSLVHYHNNDTSSAIRHQCQCLINKVLIFCRHMCPLSLKLRFCYSCYCTRSVFRKCESSPIRLFRIISIPSKFCYFRPPDHVILMD